MNRTVLRLALSACLTLLFQPSPAFAGDGVVKASFGKLPSGQTVDVYTLANKHGLIAKVITYGAILTELHVPDRQGRLGDIVLGFDNLEAYLKGHPYFGSTVGRVANRIAKGTFTLGGKTYHLAINNPPNTLHGGKVGFDKVLWKARPLKTAFGPSVMLTYRSKNGEEGFPGNLNVKVIYTLTNDNTLRIDYEATTDKATPINLTHHSYFNLAGKDRVLEHVVNINAEHYVPVDENLIPTGDLASIAGTPFDFIQPHTIGANIAQIGNIPEGYDHTYVLKGASGALKFAAKVTEPTTGRILKIWTTEPGVQFYTGNFLDGTLTGKYGTIYDTHSGFSLEAQHFPDSIHHPQFPNTVLRPGKVYRQRTVHQFLTD